MLAVLFFNTKSKYKCCSLMGFLAHPTLENPGLDILNCVLGNPALERTAFSHCMFGPL